MCPIEQDISAPKFGRRDYVMRWIRDNAVHPAIAGIMRRGAHFARLPFTQPGGRGLNNFHLTTELSKSTLALWNLLTRSHDSNTELFASEFEDVFASGSASLACRAVFMRRGWSSHVWAPQFVEASSFRAGIGICMMVYAIYLQRAYKAGHIDSVLAQTADVANLLLIDTEKKSANARKLRKQDLSKQNSERAKARHAKDPRQRHDKPLVRECWDDWQARKARGEKPCKSKAAFARDMLTKCSYLESEDTIKEWMREWENEKKHHSAAQTGDSAADNNYLAA